jgi:cytochrome c oxidase subunit 3
LNLFYWFFDLFIETNNIGKHNQKINASISYGFTIFMLSEICVFAGLFWGFFDRAFHPSVSLQSLYMPSGTHGLPGLALVFKGSFLLSLSCSAFNAMKRSLMLGENNRARFWGFLSLCIGLTFLFQQVEEYQNIPYMMSVNAHCSFFYAITGLHGFHVAIGILFIGAIVDRIEQEKFNQYDLMSVTFAEIYWYFVDLVWFVLLVALYAYGVYHPNCVLIEKYTPIDEWKDFIYSFGYILKEYLESFYVVSDSFFHTWIFKIKEKYSYFFEFLTFWSLILSSVIFNPYEYGFWFLNNIINMFCFFFFYPEYIDFYSSVLEAYLFMSDLDFLISFYESLIVNPIDGLFFILKEIFNFTPLSNLFYIIYNGYIEIKSIYLYIIF